ncbi:unnamed protein product, partial [Laminaria digitata]
RVIDASTLPSPAAALGGLLAQTLAPSFSRPRIFDAVWAAVTDPIQWGWNAGLRRSDAAFVVVYVSDGDDSSGLSAQGITMLGADLAGDPARFAISGAAGPRSAGCFISGLNAAASPRLADSAERSGGQHLEICDAGWPEALVQGGLPMSGHRARFSLPVPAEPGTVRVEVGGITVPEASGAWTVRADGIEFSAAAIPAAAPVEIEFQPACR